MSCSRLKVSPPTPQGALNIWFVAGLSLFLLAGGVPAERQPTMPNDSSSAFGSRPPATTATPTPADYTPDAVERIGRRMKMEYVGMASVFAVIALLIFGALAPWQRVAATAGTVFLFLGLKKKTRDHLCVSFLLFAAAAVAREPLRLAEWAVPYLLLGACVYALEGYLEKRRGRIYLLPLIFGLWSWVDFSWLLGLVFVAFYLADPRAELPGSRRRLGLARRPLGGGRGRGRRPAVRRLRRRSLAAAGEPPAARLPGDDPAARDGDSDTRLPRRLLAAAGARLTG